MDAVVTTLQGRLGGGVADGVCAFLGVPYAAPPFGANRLRPPRPAGSWDGVRDATRFGAAPPQVAPPGAAADSVGDTAAGAEDCLTLNVWMPGPGAGGLPVMVWIQGGMFEFGGQGAADGTDFARDGVVYAVRAITAQEAAEVLRQQLGSGYKVTPHSGGSQDKLTVSHGAAFATAHLGRVGDATTFRVHGGGLIIGRIVNEFGIARTVTAAIREAFGPVPPADTGRTQGGNGQGRVLQPRPLVRGRHAGRSRRG